MIENFQTLKTLQDLGTLENIEEYLLVIYGKINQEMIVSAIRLSETKLVLENIPKSIVTKMKIISAEVLQNMIKHQVKSDKWQPYFVLGFKGKTLSIITGNLLTKKSCDILVERIDHYKGIDKNKLRDFYIDTFKKAEVSPEGNAGLGILDIVFRADQNIKYKTAPFEGDLYSLELNIVLHENTSIL